MIPFHKNCIIVIGQIIVSKLYPFLFNVIVLIIRLNSKLKFNIECIYDDVLMGCLGPSLA